MLLSDDLPTASHELVRVFREPEVGLLAVIAVHSTQLGPAMGGVRRRAYDSLDEAISDVLRLSGAMTLKNSAAGLPLGGGKAVIVDDNALASPALVDAFADAVESLDGRYVAAEDIGTTPADMDRMTLRTRWVAGQSPGAGGNGDPSPATAHTVFQALLSAAAVRWGAPDVAGRTVGVLGVGKVGGALAELAAAAGASVLAADVSAERAAAVAARVGGVAVSPQALLETPVDVLAPCATGGLVTPALAQTLPVEILCGAANNMLATRDVAPLLADRGVLYVPDFLANAGGIIHVGGAFLDWDEAEIEAALARSIAQTRAVLEEAAARQVPPERLAYERALHRLPAETSIV